MQTRVNISETCAAAQVHLPHGCQKNMQHTLLSHGDAGGVGKVNESSYHLRADITQGDLWGVTLFEAAGEHGPEIGATGGQYHLVHLEMKEQK